MTPMMTDGPPVGPEMISGGRAGGKRRRADLVDTRWPGDDPDVRFTNADSSDPEDDDDGLAGGKLTMQIPGDPARAPPVGRPDR